MDKRTATREAHGLVADMIAAHLRSDERFLDDEPSADEDRINAALKEIEETHRRKSIAPPPKEEGTTPVAVDLMAALRASLRVHDKKD